MGRAHDRHGIPIEHRVPLLEGDVDDLHAQWRLFDARLDQTTEAVNGKLNKILVALLGLALTIVGGIVTAVVTSGVAS